MNPVAGHDNRVLASPASLGSTPHEPRLAHLAAELDDAFAIPDKVFARTGLDDAAHRRLVDGWRARFREDATGELAARFAGAYAEARAKQRSGRGRGARGEQEHRANDPRFLNTDAQAFREEAARVARDPVSADTSAMPLAPSPILSPAPPIAEPIAPRPRSSFAGTMDISDAIPRDLLPFTAAPASPPAPPPPPAPAPRAPVSTGTTDISAFVPRHLLPFPSAGPPPAPPPPSPVAPIAEPAPQPSVVITRPPQHLAATADISAFVPRPATPFTPPEAAPPRKRLIRFDPQTGQPLPAPIWVDLPPEPESK